ncbi:MAG: hypothetical protein ACOX64_06565 [Candidatus Merdivicinus sp.]|jgi:ABC-type bacteriocin/lantibiotic exporter with double-glycine peptidase domain
MSRVKNKSTTVSIICKTIRMHTWLLFLIILSSVLLVIMTSVQPLVYQQLVDNVSLGIPPLSFPCKMVAVVGESGSGKSACSMLSAVFTTQVMVR